MIRSFRKCYSDKAVILIVLPDLVFAEPGKGKYGANRYVRFIDKTLLEDEYSLKNKILLSYFPLFIPDIHNFKVCIKRILSYSASQNEYYTLRHNYISKKENIVAAEKRCKDWCDEFHLENTISADIPLALYDKFEQSTTILTKIIDYCLGENLRPILVVTPLSSIMREKISQSFLDKVLYSNIKRANIQGIPVLDYLNDERFSDIDLYANNADFLNARGRELFTNIVLDDIKKLYDR